MLQPGAKFRRDEWGRSGMNHMIIVYIIWGLLTTIPLEKADSLQAEPDDQFHFCCTNHEIRDERREYYRQRKYHVTSHPSRQQLS